jgi:hypothetical protein
MEMWGSSDELRENGLHHSPTTQSRRLSPLRVKHQFVVVYLHSADH